MNINCVVYERIPIILYTCTHYFIMLGVSTAQQQTVTTKSQWKSIFEVIILSGTHMTCLTA